MNYVYEENKCTDLRAEFKDIRDKVDQLIAARSTLTHFSHTYENKCLDLRAVFTTLESVVKHFPTTYIDDIGKRFSQFKEARVAHMQLPNTHPLCKRCSYCYSPYHKREKCPFILDYLVDEDEIVDNEEEHTKQVEHAQVTTRLESEEIVDNNEEQVEQIERVKHHEKSQPPTDLNLSSNTEVSTEALACITAPLETHQEPKASSLECLQEPSYVKILKDLCTQVRKSRNHFPKKIHRSKKFYIRWQNILPDGYEVLKKKGWKGLVGH
jgi:hypothetical protein